MLRKLYEEFQRTTTIQIGIQCMVCVLWIWMCELASIEYGYGNLFSQIAGTFCVLEKGRAYYSFVSLVCANTKTSEVFDVVLKTTKVVCHWQEGLSDCRILCSISFNKRVFSSPSKSGTHHTPTKTTVDYGNQSGMNPYLIREIEKGQTLF